MMYWAMHTAYMTIIKTILSLKKPTGTKKNQINIHQWPYQNTMTLYSLGLVLGQFYTQAAF